MGLVTFQIDGNSPHPGVRIEDDMAIKDTNGGWVTLRSTKALSPGNHQWALKIHDHGDHSDGSGIMIGMLPKLSPSAVASLGSKYISELGGWCISRAGQVYGPWKMDRITFSTGSVVEWDVDVSREMVTLTCGKDRTCGYVSGLRDAELYPAFSLYYLNQKVSFV
eukprot:TRINITY_DN51042_c0_g1_i1.p1 TRINITY_DN51042_c0_g1~~TRINITY_DN51042_c0_g1_i1.p1  ORF type:complete len:165 (+),score=61.89 TRINITY_DN51042_c0_g1_i1:74-568(+)